MSVMIARVAPGPRGMHRQVDGHQTHTWREMEHRGGEVQDAVDPGGHQGVGDVLSSFGRDSHDAELGAAFLNDLRHALGGMDFQAVDNLAHFAGVRIEDDILVTEAGAESLSPRVSRLETISA